MTRSILKVLLALSLVAAALPEASAAIVSYTQVWVDRDMPERTLVTFTQWDDAGLAGAGVDRVLARNSFYARYELGGAPQLFMRAEPFELPLDAHDLVAVYDDGVFRGIGGFGIVPRVPVFDAANGNGAGGFAIAGSELIWLFNPSGAWYFDLQSSALEVPGNVPLPAAVWLLPAALAVLARRGVRRRVR